MSPEAILLTINAIFLAFAYLWAYPVLPEKTGHAIMIRALAISGAALGLAAMLFIGSETKFNLVFFETNWFAFSILSMFMMEMPLFLWFAKKHNIRFDDDP